MMENNNDGTSPTPRGPDEGRTLIEAIRPFVSLIGQCVRWAVELLDALGRFR